MSRFSGFFKTVKIFMVFKAGKIYQIVKSVIQSLCIIKVSATSTCSTGRSCFTLIGGFQGCQGFQGFSRLSRFFWLSRLSMFSGFFKAVKISMVVKAGNVYRLSSQSSRPSINTCSTGRCCFTLIGGCQGCQSLQGFLMVAKIFMVVKARLSRLSSQSSNIKAIHQHLLNW